MWSLNFFWKTLVLIAVIISADQASKFYMMHTVFAETSHISLLPFLDFVPVYNQGVSFGLFKSLGPLFLSAATATLIIGLIVLFFTENVKMYKIAYAIIIGGALGNLIDRMRMNAVFDFISFHYKGYAFPAFNIADSMITLGACIYLLALLKDRP